jgi:outer membrane protein TolC
MKLRPASLTLVLLGCLGVSAAEPWTLERAIEFALSNNPDARLAHQRVAAAQAALEQAGSAFWPRLQFQSSYTRTDNPMLVFGSILNQRAYSASLNFNDVPDVDDLNLRGLVTVPLYAGGRNAAERDAARATVTAATQSHAAIRNTMAFEVVRAFHTILKSREFVRATHSAVNAFEQHLAVARKRLDAGTLLRSDLLDIEVRLAQANEDLVRARNVAALAERILQNLLGIEQAGFDVVDTAPTADVPPSRDLSSRPELSAASQRERAAEAQVRSARSGYRPQVSAFGSIDQDYGFVTDGDGFSYTAGILLQWDLWNGWDTRSRTRLANATLETAREEQRQLRLALGLELEQAELNLKSASERLAVTAKSIEQATESAKLTRNRFEQGLALSTHVIDAETALVAARVRRAEAEADRHIAVAALRKALAIPQLDLPGARSYE